MSLSDATRAELAELVDGLREQMLTDVQLTRLNHLLRSEKEWRKEYILMTTMYSTIDSMLSIRDNGSPSNPSVAAILLSEIASRRTRPLDVASPGHDGAITPCSPMCPHAGRFGWLNPVSYLSSGWPAAYLITTVIFAVGAILGSFIHVSQTEQVAVKSRPAVGERAASPTAVRTVGQITGTTDCKWAGTGRVSREVVLGSKYQLVSGLMEITYNTGAKVILQGPATYEIESDNGGFLFIGKLMGKVEDKKAKGFFVSTPTATVTDIGTEFGVEVSKEGNTTSHVFQGVVEVQSAQSSGDGRKYAKPIRLTANNSVEVKRKLDDGTVSIHHIAADPQSFLRIQQFEKSANEKPLQPLRQWQAYSRQLRNDPALLAYYTFENTGETNAILPNLSAAGRALDAHVEGAEWVYGRIPGKHALYFHGSGTGDRVVLPEQERFNFAGPFTVAVWFRAEQFRSRYHALVTKGDTSWRLQRYNTTSYLSFDTSRGPSEIPHIVDATCGQTPVDDQKWHFVVIVYEPEGAFAHKSLYLDGRLESQSNAPLPLLQNNEPVYLGANSTAPNCEFWGVIDEVAIFSRALLADEVAKMFDNGNPDTAGKREAEEKH